jgi:hypothetical protein
MTAVQPPKNPSFDSKTFSQRLYERVLSAAGKPYAVFDPVNDAGAVINLPRWIGWVNEKLYGAVKANAVFLDDTNDDVVALKNTVAKIDSRVAALEAASGPFLSGSG